MLSPTWLHLHLPPLLLLLLLPFHVLATSDPGGRPSTPVFNHELVNITNRYRDSMGTALRLERFGHLRKHQVVHTLRSGSLANLLQQNLAEALRTRRCLFDDTHGCDMAYDGFGTVGEVQYVFEDERTNLQGRSAQTMVACRCLGRECKEAVLLQPIHVHRDGDTNDVVRNTCVFERVKDTDLFAECHTELLRVTSRKKPRTTAEAPGNLQFFEADSNAPWVYDLVRDAGWLAYGQRGWRRAISESEYNKLNTFNLSELASRIEDKMGSDREDEQFYFAYRQAAAETELVRESTIEGGEDCGEIYEYSVAGAAWYGSQQDEIAIGRLGSAYLEPQPPLITTTELTLSCSAAALGTYTIWRISRRPLDTSRTALEDLLIVLFIQILLHALESLPLHLALVGELRALRWESQFAYVDGTLAVAQDMGRAKTARESVYIATALIGQVSYFRTRVGLVIGLVVFFDVAGLAGLVATVVKRIRLMRNVEMGTGNDANDSWVFLSNKMNQSLVQTYLGSESLGKDD